MNIIVWIYYPQDQMTAVIPDVGTCPKLFATSRMSKPERK